MFLAPILLLAQTPVPLQEGTATFSQVQTATFSPDQVYDGILTTLNGWAIYDTAVAGTLEETAVWETAANLPPGRIDFELIQNHGTTHLLGRFRLSVTTDSRSSFADGLDNNGDVTANWTVLLDPTVTLPAGMTYSVLADGSILIAGTIALTGTYEIGYSLPCGGVTGIRLELLEHSSLPFNGPGLHIANGNLVLTELEVSYTPHSGLFLEALNLVGGQQATLRVSNATPGGLVAIAYSLAGNGPVNANVPGCGITTLLLSPPITALPTVRADATGCAELSGNVPAALSGRPLWLHSVDLSSCATSNGVAQIVG